MRVQKFQAPTMPEAMAQVRDSLGEDAVILHSKSVPAQGIGAVFGKRMVEVTAAVDSDLRDFPRPTPAAQNAIYQLDQEVAAIRQTLSQVTTTRETSGAPTSGLLDECYIDLLNRGIVESLARQIIQTVSDETSRWTLGNRDLLNEHLAWQLARRLPPMNPIRLDADRAKLLALVGPTGVGKTTTIAKLAATFAGQARVLWLTVDTFRVGAVAQSKAFGDILGVPVRAAFTTEQFTGMLSEAREEYDLVLVDTPGCGPRDQQRTAAIGAHLSGAAERTTVLTLAAGTPLTDMRNSLDYFAQWGLDGLLFTKVDEASSLGAAYTLACESRLPLMYLGMGQQVPHDIEVASPMEVANLLLTDGRNYLERSGNSLPGTEVK